VRGLPPPDAAVWRARNDWFWRAHDINAGPRPLDLDPRAAALLAELELLFCVGAWAAVTILAWTLVEGADRRAAQRDEHPAPDLDWLREKRNALAHLGEGSAAPDDAELESIAQGAVRIVFKTLFSEAWIAPR
jgi:hypothetical protein